MIYLRNSQFLFGMSPVLPIFYRGSTPHSVHTSKRDCTGPGGGQSAVAKVPKLRGDVCIGTLLQRT